MSDRSVWMVVIIVVFALPPTIMAIPLQLHCLDPSISDAYHDLASELLVVSITWWYTYQSYRIRRGLKLGNTVSSLLLYNGKSSHTSFLAILWSLDLILSTTPVPGNVETADSLMTIFYDPIVSILVCRFMLSIRAFDSTLSSMATLPGIPSENAASMVLPFGAQPSDSLPAFISSFAHPVHVDSPLSEMHPDQ
ncbi:hypothetical protein V8D89_001178 [Ganoderma adspersum]